MRAAGGEGADLVGALLAHAFVVEGEDLGFLGGGEGEGGEGGVGEGGCGGGAGGHCCCCHGSISLSWVRVEVIWRG